MGVKFEWGLSAPAHPQFPGGCSDQPQPHVSILGKKKLLPPRRWRQHLPQLAKIKLLSLEKAAGAGQSSPRQPCHPSTPNPAEPARPTAGYHRDSILPGKCVPAPLCPKLLELAATHPGLQDPGDSPAGLVPRASGAGLAREGQTARSVPGGWAERGGQRNETGPLPVPCTIRKGSIPLAAKPRDRPRVPSMARGGHVPDAGDRGHRLGSRSAERGGATLRAPRRTPTPLHVPAVCPRCASHAPHRTPGCRRREPTPAPLIPEGKPRSAPAGCAPSPTLRPPSHPRGFWPCTPGPPPPGPLCTP